MKPEYSWVCEVSDYLWAAETAGMASIITAIIYSMLNEIGKYYINSTLFLFFLQGFYEEMVS